MTPFDIDAARILQATAAHPLAQFAERERARAVRRLRSAAAEQLAGFHAPANDIEPRDGRPPFVSGSAGVVHAPSDTHRPGGAARHPGTTQQDAGR